MKIYYKNCVIRCQFWVSLGKRSLDNVTLVSGNYKGCDDWGVNECRSSLQFRTVFDCIFSEKLIMYQKRDNVVIIMT